MRRVLLALAVAVLAALVLVMPVSAQVPPPVGAATFYVPQSGVDPVGRPYALDVAGWYGFYDGAGYPVVVNTVGVYAGVPVVRTWFGYVPVPPPFAPLVSYGPPVAIPLAY